MSLERGINPGRMGNSSNGVFTYSGLPIGVKHKCHGIVTRLGAFSDPLGTTYSSEVTHVVVPADGLFLSPNVLTCLVAGKFVVTTNYLFECEKQNRFVDEKIFCPTSLLEIATGVRQYGKMFQGWRVLLFVRNESKQRDISQMLRAGGALVHEWVTGELLSRNWDFILTERSCLREVGFSAFCAKADPAVPVLSYYFVYKFINFYPYSKMGVQSICEKYRIINSFNPLHPHGPLKNLRKRLTCSEEVQDVDVQPVVARGCQEPRQIERQHHPIVVDISQSDEEGTEPGRAPVEVITLGSQSDDEATETGCSPVEVVTLSSDDEDDDVVPAAPCVDEVKSSRSAETVTKAENSSGPFSLISDVVSNACASASSTSVAQETNAKKSVHKKSRSDRNRFDGEPKKNVSKEKSVFDKRIVDKCLSTILRREKKTDETLDSESVAAKTFKFDLKKEVVEVTNSSATKKRLLDTDRYFHVYFDNLSTEEEVLSVKVCFAFEMVLQDLQGTLSSTTFPSFTTLNKLVNAVLVYFGRNVTSEEISKRKSSICTDLSLFFFKMVQLHLPTDDDKRLYYLSVFVQWKSGRPRNFQARPKLEQKFLKLLKKCIRCYESSEHHTFLAETIVTLIRKDFDFWWKHQRNKSSQDVPLVHCICHSSDKEFEKNFVFLLDLLLVAVRENSSKIQTLLRTLIGVIAMYSSYYDYKNRVATVKLGEASGSRKSLLSFLVFRRFVSKISGGWRSTWQQLHCMKPAWLGAQVSCFMLNHCVNFSSPAKELSLTKFLSSHVFNMNFKFVNEDDERVQEDSLLQKATRAALHTAVIYDRVETLQVLHASNSSQFLEDLGLHGDDSLTPIGLAVTKDSCLSVDFLLSVIKNQNWSTEKIFGDGIKNCQSSKMRDVLKRHGFAARSSPCDENVIVVREKKLTEALISVAIDKILSSTSVDNVTLSSLRFSDSHFRSICLRSMSKETILANRRHDDTSVHFDTDVKLFKDNLMADIDLCQKLFTSSEERKKLGRFSFKFNIL